MQFEGVCPNAITFLCGLRACASLNAVNEGQKIHAEIDRKGFLNQDLAIGNMLVDMYAKCGALDKAEEVFDNILVRDVISWTALIAGLIEHGNGDKALESFIQMQQEGICPNAITFSCGVKACSLTWDINKGKEMHSLIKHTDTLACDAIVSNTLVDMYAKCGLLDAACIVFNELPTRNIAGWTALISGYADCGQSEEVLKCFDLMEAEGVTSDSMSLACSLKACSNLTLANKGQELHAEIERTGFIVKDAFIGISLVNMYAKCGLFAKAQEVFIKLPVQEVTAWTILIGAYIDHACEREALTLFEKMQLKGVLPNTITFVHCLKSCTNLMDINKGQEIHADIEKLGYFEGHLSIGNALIGMYSKCNFLDEACILFDKLPLRDTVSWNLILAAFLEHKQIDKVLDLLAWMHFEGVAPDPFTCACSLKVYSSIGDIEVVQMIHSEIQKKGLLEDDILLGNMLVDAYATCGFLSAAECIFSRLPKQDVVSWNTLITGYCEHGDGETVLMRLELMQGANIPPNSISLVCALRACVQIADIKKAQEFHVEIERQGLLQDIVIGNTLVDTYGKFGLLGKSYEVFVNLPKKDVVSWTALLAGYADYGHGKEALMFVKQMQSDGMDLNDVTYICILKACISGGLIREGLDAHGEIERRELLEKYVEVGVALIDFYAKNELIARAHEVFDSLPARNVLAWNTLIVGYAENGCAKEALNLFECMLNDGFSPDVQTFSFILMVSGMIGDKEWGWYIHSELEKKGLFQASALGNMIVDMYAKCGSFPSAQTVFFKISDQDLVAWNALVTGFAEHGHAHEALHWFEHMSTKGIFPNTITFLGALKACTTLGFLNKGLEIHANIARLNLLESDAAIGNSLINMYAKCGVLTKAREIFHSIPDQSVISWTALIAGCIEHECDKEALMYYKHMQSEGIIPNFVTRLCILNACSSIGTIQMGREIHAEIEKEGLAQTDVVSNALVHMYAKCGSVDEAQNVFDQLTVANVVAWNTLAAGYALFGRHTTALTLINRMLKDGLKPNMVTFVTALSVCNQCCLFNDCLMFLEAMNTEHGVHVAIEHITSIITLLCRVGQVENALAFSNKLPFVSNLVVWLSVLSACRANGDLECARVAYKHAMCLNNEDPAIPVLMSHIYRGSNT
ncbi:hypothetical protein KP509_02G042700 [Ceratopteris richardii]|nr:hypothetical protein KP509_02G042700 [Ceratopteris richardii]